MGSSMGDRKVCIKHMHFHTHSGILGRQRTFTKVVCKSVTENSGFLEQTGCRTSKTVITIVGDGCNKSSVLDGWLVGWLAG